MGLVRQLAFELSPIIRVNGVAPAGTITNLKGPKAFDQDQTSIFDQDVQWNEKISKSKPLGISPKPTDHTGAYLFLASQKNSSAVTGEIIRSDGGLRIRGLNEISGGNSLLELFDSSNDNG